MLVLSRKVGESVIIGGAVVVRVLEVRGRQARLGIEAPAEVAVVRGELQRADGAGPHDGGENSSASNA